MSSSTFCSCSSRVKGSGWAMTRATWALTASLAPRCSETAHGTHNTKSMSERLRLADSAPAAMRSTALSMAPESTPTRMMTPSAMRPESSSILGPLAAV